MNLKKFSPIFEDFDNLFEKYYLNRDIFSQVLESINNNDSESFKKLVVDNIFFGGSGALWEATPDIDYEIRTKHIDAPKCSSDEKAKDRRKFYQLFIDLINELNNQGINNGRIDQVLDYLESMKRTRV